MKKYYVLITGASKGFGRAMALEFAKRDINLTKIESRPTKKTAWEYNFYLDFEGHRTEKRCTEALEALEKYATFVKILGSYPRII